MIDRRASDCLDARRNCAGAHSRTHRARAFSNPLPGGVMPGFLPVGTTPGASCVGGLFAAFRRPIHLCRVESATQAERLERRMGHPSAAKWCSEGQSADCHRASAPDENDRARHFSKVNE